MSDCKHELELLEMFVDGSGVSVACKKCHEVDYLTIPEIERRLNATECLSAEDATSLYRVGCFEDFPILIATLLEYAKILEGDENETNPSNS